MMRVLVSLVFGLATLLCCCRTGLMQPAAVAHAPARACCAAREGSKKSPARPEHCPVCEGVIGIAVKGEAQNGLPPLVPLPPIALADWGTEFRFSVEFQSVARLAAGPPPGPTLVSLHTCLLC